MNELLNRLEDFAGALAAILIACAVTLWMGLIVVAAVRGSNPSRCPTCLSERIRLSWPKLQDKILGFSRVTAYRCLVCEKRFYALGRQLKWNERRF